MHSFDRRIKNNAFRGASRGPSQPNFFDGGRLQPKSTADNVLENRLVRLGFYRNGMVNSRVAPGELKGVELRVECVPGDKQQSGILGASPLAGLIGRPKRLLVKWMLH